MKPAIKVAAIFLGFYAASGTAMAEDPQQFGLLCTIVETYLPNDPHNPPLQRLEYFEIDLPGKAWCSHWGGSLSRMKDKPVADWANPESPPPCNFATPIGQGGDNNGIWGWSPSGFDDMKWWIAHDIKSQSAMEGDWLLLVNMPKDDSLGVSAYKAGINLRTHQYASHKDADPKTGLGETTDKGPCEVLPFSGITSEPPMPPSH
jgi:hypothetical protein